MIILGKTKFNLEEKVLIECDFKSSLKCKGQYLKLYKNILLGRKNNDGKDRCQYCFNSLTKTGINNFNYKYDKKEDFFENIDTELKSYLLGFIAGDGCIKKDGLFLENHIEDIEILDLFKTHICPSAVPYKHSDPIRGANTMCLKIHSVQMVKDLCKHLKLNTYGKKSHKIQLPDLSKDLQWHFVRGLFDSDGNIASPFSKKTSPTASICSMSDKIRADIKKLCDENNIGYYKTEGNFSVLFGGNNCLDFLNIIYNNANYFLTRKHKLWGIWKTWKPGLGTVVRPRKTREYYPPLSEEHKEKIRESNKKRKGTKYERN